jgi:blocked-early-in-transport protein 1
MYFQNDGREHRNSRTALFDDGLEEGGLRPSSSFSHETDDHDNDKAVHTLQDRVLFLKSVCLSPKLLN